MTILDKYINKALIYRAGEVYPFVVAKLININSKVGDEIESYRGGENFYFTDIASALLYLYNIKYNISCVQTVMENVDLRDYDIFECPECGRTLDMEEICVSHYHGGERTCKYCCEQCQNDINYWNDINERIDNERHPE